MLQRLVGREAGPDRGDLEEHAARLPEVDRLEVEAVDHRGRMRARFGHAPLPGLVLVHRRGPRDVVDGARARDPALGRRGVVGVVRAAFLAAGLPAVGAAFEAERLLEKRAAALGRRRVRTHRVEAVESQLRGNLGVLSDEGLVLGLDDSQLEAHPLGVGEAQARVVALDVDPLGAEPVGPEVERLRRGDPPRDPVHHPRARPARDRAWVLEEGEVAAGASDLVRVEQVVDGRIVLVDRLLDEPEPEDARVEVEVPGRVARDRRDVVDPLESHPCSLRLSSSVLPVNHPRGGVRRRR